MKNPQPLPSQVPRANGEFTVGRRSCLDQHHPVETKIRDALIAVEGLGADALLTDAVTLLSQAQNRVADWLEGKTGDYVDGKVVVKE